MITKPTMKTLRPELLPGAMKAPKYTRWLIWKWHLPQGADKFTKRSVDPDTGILSSYNDEDKWMTFDAAFKACVDSRWTYGLGFVPGDGIFGIDLDNCVGPNGIEHPVAKLIVEKFGTFAELS